MVILFKEDTVLTRIALLCLFVLGVTGCATTAKTPPDQIQARVTELEKKLEEKDAEIVDLQYEVKDLSSKVETTNAEQPDQTQAPASAAAFAVKSAGNDQIIRVNANPAAVQTALKNAGVYMGKIDGKVGAGTKTAIVEFQKSHGLKADGILGRKTWEELKTYLK